MKTATPLPKLTTWSACSQLAELALVMDALPAEFRGHLVQAALTTDRLHGNESYLVGEIRSLIFDCLTQLYGQSVSLSCFVDHRDLARIELPISLRDSADPAKIQLAVCDLMEDLAVSLISDSKEQHHES